jgi:predicted ATPase
VWFVDLAPLRDPHHIASSVARALGLKPQADRPLISTIASSLADRSALVVVDNFEHLVEGGTVLTEILRSSPDSAMVVTSREALRLYGEQEYPVPALDVENGSQPGPAMLLFVARAREIEPNIEFGLNDLNAIKTVCERLDGLPLAIELAAAKVRVLSPSAMLERLQQSLDVLRSGARDVPPRHQALAATFEWSHELLSEDEQVLFRRLAVFRGGFTLEAAETVCAGDRIAVADVMDLLYSLATKSLLRREGSTAGARFRMLETVCEFARARLNLSPEAREMKLAHLRYFRDLAEREAPLLKSEHELATLARMDAEQSNLRAALECSREAGDSESQLRIIGALWFYWNVRGETHEGLAWLHSAPLDDERVSPDLRAEAWIGEARLNMSEGHSPRAARAGRKLLELATSCEVPGRYMGWGYVAQCPEGFDEGERVQSLAERALKFMLESGDHWDKAVAFTMMGEVERTYGSLEAAATAYGNAVRLLLDNGGELLLLGTNHHNLAQTALMRSDLEGAEAQFLKAFDAGRQLGASKLMLHSLVGLANVTRARGRYVAAARILGCADAAFARAGFELHPADKPPRVRLENELRAALGDAAYEELHAQGSRVDPDEMVITPEALEGVVS